MDLIHQGLSLVQNPRHTTWIAPLLVLADTALSLLVVWKVPCKSFRTNTTASIPYPNLKPRYRNRLESLQPANPHLPLWRTRLCQNIRRDRSLSLPSRARLHLPLPPLPHRLRDQHPSRPVYLRRSLPRHSQPGAGNLSTGSGTALGPANACAEQTVAFDLHAQAVQ